MGLARALGIFAPLILSGCMDFSTADHSARLPDVPKRVYRKAILVDDSEHLRRDEYFVISGPSSYNSMTRDLAEDRLEAILSSLPHSYRSDSNAFYDEGFLNQKKDLSIFELRKLLYLCNQFSRDEVRRSMARLVLWDLSKGEVQLQGMDKNGCVGEFVVDASKTELGGLMMIGDSGLEFVLYEPAIARSNDSYVPNNKLRSSYHHSIGYFHLHATRFNDGGTAGPCSNKEKNRGDMGVAKNWKAAMFVLTSVGTNQARPIDRFESIRVNVDYFNGDVVIDLGTYVCPLPGK